ITGAPYFTFDPKLKDWAPSRHPLTRPLKEHLRKMTVADERPNVRTRSYDLVINGVEVGTGSIRNHEVGLQRRVLRMLGMNDEVIEAQFGPLLKAFAFGAPPHAAISLGVARLVAVLLGLGQAQAAIAFPKGTDGGDPLLGSPSPLSSDAVDDLLEG
ncbi:amino acid--tRNA ligase-related protein, partial [Planctomycetota bacterium]